MLLVKMSRGEATLQETVIKIEEKIAEETNESVKNMHYMEKLRILRLARRYAVKREIICGFYKKAELDIGEID